MRGAGTGGGQPMAMPLTKVVKYLIIANVGIWLFFQVILEGYIFPSLDLSLYFGLVPQNIFLNFFVWQFGTYMFLHDTSNIMHLVFNMFTLWWIGSELEQKWGSKSFLSYYLSCGVGAGIIYFVGVLSYYFLTGHVTPLQIPVVGASGAIFGLMLAYGILFSERQLLFMFIFPMKAKHFILVLGAIELSMLMSQGMSGGKVANLAHLGGIISGYLYLHFWAKREKRKGGGGGGDSKKKSNLKLIVNNDKPKYWN
jgi:membrane associated rhomboid family serine protease